VHRHHFFVSPVVTGGNVWASNSGVPVGNTIRPLSGNRAISSHISSNANGQLFVLPVFQVDGRRFADEVATIEAEVQLSALLKVTPVSRV
jgi:hypothetical protein